MSSQKPTPEQQGTKPSSAELARKQAELKAQIERHLAQLRQPKKK
ncbi:hypothetical protein [Streptomyces sp. XD-27]|nr:hypothetical protein [Streptomyces sp. XD-27]WKX70061.1 hypothetical protein Q3Y56_09180 [Streptomyces sp. XD-27]